MNGRKQFWFELGSILLIILCSVIIGVGGYILYQEYYGGSSPPTNSVNTSGMLYLSATKLHNELMTFYKYNITNIGKSLDFNTLKSEGGVCSHFSDWYYEHARERGFFGKEVIIDLNERDKHEFTVISSDEGYCILDQSYFKCFGLTSREELK